MQPLQFFHGKALSRIGTQFPGLYQFAVIF